MSDKKKYYLRGLSIGMILTCVILSIVFKNTDKELSDKEFADLAAKKGYVLKSELSPTTAINMEELKKTPVPSPSSTPVATPSATPSSTPVASTPTSEPTNSPSATPTSTPTNTTAVTPTVTPTNTPTVTPLPTPGPETTEMTVATIVVESGFTSERVSALLQEAKIIKSAADFNNYISINHVGNCFYPGTFSVNDKMSYSDLIYVFSYGRVRLE